MTTFRTAQAALRTDCPTITVRKTDCGEYRATFTIDAIRAAWPEMSRAEAIDKAEALASYADTVADMIDNARAMYAAGLAPAPEAPSDEQVQREAAEAQVAIGKVETIEIQMGWSDCLNMLLTLYADGNASGRKYARDELRRMAALADKACS